MALDRQEDDMKIAGKRILITGANRGVGEALVTEALRRGPARIYAGTRGAPRHPEGRVTPLALDVTDEAQIQRAAQDLEGLDLLINNAGIALYDDLGKLETIEQQLAVNCFGSLRVSRALLPLLERSGGPSRTSSPSRRWRRCRSSRGTRSPRRPPCR
jgi:NAD(P)-dependent dehydrogenase (short-subunit alcohol dehydrogenase family)